MHHSVSQVFSIVSEGLPLKLKMFDVLVGARPWILCARFLMSCNGNTEFSKYLYSVDLPKFMRYVLLLYQSLLCVCLLNSF